MSPSHGHGARYGTSNYTDAGAGETWGAPEIDLIAIKAGRPQRRPNRVMKRFASGAAIAASIASLAYAVTQILQLLGWTADREGAAKPLRRPLMQPRLERFIGVIYRPETERWSHYSECSLSQQFDALVWFDRTTAVTALPTPVRKGPDDTWPSGL